MSSIGGTTNFNIVFKEGEDAALGTSTEPLQEGAPDENNPTKSKSGIKQMAGFAVAKQLGKNIFGYVTNHVQVYTGSSDLQQKVNAGMSILSTATAIIANPAMGLAMTAFNLATKAMDLAIKRDEERRRVNQTLVRAGPSFNLSRKA